MIIGQTRREGTLGLLSIAILSVGVTSMLLTFAASAGEYAGRGAANAFGSVFRIGCQVPGTPNAIDLGGTAFGHKSGNVISASHVVESCLKVNGGALQLAAADGSVSQAVPVIRDADLDLVLLKPDTAGFVKNPLSISSSDKMTIGAQVSTWGFPNGYSGSMALLTVGYLAGSDPDPTRLSIRRWIVNAAINRGNSGGPLLETDTPAVIGVVLMKLNPLTRQHSSELEALAKDGGPEAKTLAQAMLDLSNRAQLVIGHSVLTLDLRAFLLRADVQP